MARKKGKLEFRYYEVPHGEPLLALLGDVWVRPYGYDENMRPITDLHFHNLLEVGYCYDGTGEIVLENESIRYSAGTITVIPPNYPHTTNSDNRQNSRWEYLFIDVDKTMQALIPRDMHHAAELLERMNRRAFCTTAGAAPGLARLVRELLQEMKERREMYEDAVNGLLCALFVEICRNNPETAKEEVSPRQRRAEQLQVTRALEYVGDYYDRPLKVSDLAGACHMSETHFRRVFVRCMGMHPVDYINLVRIRMACRRLKKTNEPIGTVASKCGFSSLATFNRNFRKFMGTSPIEWKKRPEAYENRLSSKNIERYEGWR